MSAVTGGASVGWRKVRFVAAYLIAFATPGLAQVDGAALAERIAQSQMAIWPDFVFAVRLNGCQLHVRQSTPGDRTEVRDATWFLADFETHPEQLVVDDQTMSDGTNTWVDSSVLFPLMAGVRAAHAADILRYESAADEIYGEETSSWGWLWRRGQTAAETYEKAVKLVDDRRNGVFGPLLQRNIGIAEGESVLGGPYYESYGLIDTDFGFVFRDDVMDGILSDLHQHRLENCPPAD